MKNIIQEFEKVIGIKISDKEELENYLTDKFQNYVKNSEDIQEAFDTMDIELNKLLGKYCCYSISKNKDGWRVAASKNYTKDSLPKILNNWNKYNNSNIDDLDEILGSLEFKMMKYMSNIGCDAFNALSMILKEVKLENYFFIDNVSDSPSINLINY